MFEKEEILEQDDLLLLEEDDEDTLTDRYLTFYINKQLYAVEIRHITEIIGIQKITKVPNIKPFVKGIINLRGIIVPIINVRKRFRLNEVEYDERTCIIVVNYDDVEIGLIVDEVADVINIPFEELSPPPETNKGNESRYIQAMAKISGKITILLDIEKVLYDSEKNISGK